MLAGLALIGFGIFWFLGRGRLITEVDEIPKEKGHYDGSSVSGVTTVSATLPPSPPHGGPKYPASSRYSVSNYAASERPPLPEGPYGPPQRYNVDSTDDLFDPIR